LFCLYSCCVLVLFVFLLCFCFVCICAMFFFCLYSCCVFVLFVLVLCFCFLKQKHSTNTSKTKSQHEYKQNKNTARIQTKQKHSTNTNKTKTQHEYKQNKNTAWIQTKQKHNTNTNKTKTVLCFCFICIRAVFLFCLYSCCDFVLLVFVLCFCFVCICAVFLFCVYSCCVPNVASIKQLTSCDIIWIFNMKLVDPLTVQQIEWVSDCCLTPTQQFSSHIMVRTG
jgi:Flp pilus assembly protein TadB